MTERGRILLIDDSEILLALVKDALEEEGWLVRTASDGPTGLRLAEEWSPEVVVCDLHMPEMSGMQVMEAMQATDRRVPFVMLSGDDDLGAVLSAVRHGAFDYVIKATHDIRPLIAAVDRAVQHARLARENERLTTALKQANAELQDRLAQLDEQHRLLSLEQERSEMLLLNILPEAIADRLKAEDRVIVDAFSDVSVLFADIAQFTDLTAHQSPHDVVQLLNDVFSRFDRLADEHGLEKIKTIGDAYMAAAGLPMPRDDHAVAAAAMALDMLDEIERVRQERNLDIAVRIGINSGPVVAGVIGTKKFIYDLWGDTVNVAARMESHGIAGRVQVTEETRKRLNREFELSDRGEIEVKGLGPVHTYFLTRHAES